ncbi:iron chelate uptake ABC transporter family permease subunit [Neomegalonema sp.]|uniref:FecCD family ABC transporter permease n=1 Tax=Neomegalonema sp. TaxID=2039713 RepID=UPI00261D98D5|nr:iron chelate uptake ABC transporter family permease subunit [Neomegalonema sp.]MDD2868460.1 iron chelate uptake ABC transporter family permease subunit [Neomegalonema sp.]
MSRLALLLALSLLAGIAFGEVPLGLSDWLAALRGESRAASLILFELRLPRALTAAGAGAALGLSGAIFQILLRNPLASPDVMGFTSGAALGAILTLGAGGAASLGVSFGAALGGLATALAVGLLARRGGRIEPLRMVLVGIGAAAALSALCAMAISRMSLTEAADAQRWLAGSLAGRDWGHAAQIGGSLAALAFMTALLTRSLELLELGEDLAASLGARVESARAALALTGVLAAAAGAAAAGPLPFVALMAAPLAGAFLGAARTGARLGGAALAGAMVAVLADLVARLGIGGVQLPVGALTGLLGGPWLLWRISREMKEGRL